MVRGSQRGGWMHTANLRTKILNFRGFDSSRILIRRGGILMSIGNFPDSLRYQILVGIILVGRLGVDKSVGMRVGLRLRIGTQHTYNI